MIPGILLFASAILAPVLVIENNAGPFEAIGKSVGYSKGNVLRISAVLFGIWVPYLLVLILSALVFQNEGLTAEATGFAVSLLLAMIGLLIPAVAVVVYRALAEGSVTPSGNQPALPTNS